MSTVPKRQHSVKSPAPRHTPAGAVLTDLIIPIIRLEAHFSRAGESIASTAGQTLARWLTLEMVADRPATVAQIAKRLDLTRQSVQRIADLLAQDRLTEYVDNPAHRTSKLVRLTGRGRRTLSSIQASLEQTQAQLTKADTQIQSGLATANQDYARILALNELAILYQLPGGSAPGVTTQNGRFHYTIG